jgi:hypothetical protein
MFFDNFLSQGKYVSKLEKNNQKYTQKNKKYR